MPGVGHKCVIHEAKGGCAEIEGYVTRPCLKTHTCTQICKHNHAYIHTFNLKKSKLYRIIHMYRNHTIRRAITYQ